MDAWTIVASASVLLPLIIGLVRFQRLDPAIRPVVYYILFSFIFSISSLFVVFALQKSNQWLIWLHASIELGFIAYIYQRVLGSALPRWFFPVLMGSFLLLFTVLAAQNGIGQMPVALRTVEACIVIALCIFYFYHISRELNMLHLERSAMFWVTTAFLIFFCATTFFFLLISQINQLDDPTQGMMLYHYFFQAPIIVANFLISIGLWQDNL